MSNSEFNQARAMRMALAYKDTNPTKLGNTSSCKWSDKQIAGWKSGNDNMSIDMAEEFSQYMGITVYQFIAWGECVDVGGK